jgi:hypothetical protein
MKKLIATAGLLLAVPMFASARNANHQSRGQGYVFFGLGTGTQCGGWGQFRPGYCPHPVFNQAGGGGEGFLYKGLAFGAELGYASCLVSYNSWIASADFSYHLRRRTAHGVDPFVLGGPSLLAPTPLGQGRVATAGNFGGGANLWLAKHAALRVEFRDVVSANFWPYSNYLSFRIGMTFR